MIRTLIAILIGLSLVSFAPVPATLPAAIIVRQPVQTIVTPRAATVYRVRLAVKTSAPVQQECSYELAPPTARQSALIFDFIGYPYGSVAAFSCSGDSLAVARELIQRADQMQAEATAYRQAHPITGLKAP